MTKWLKIKFQKHYGQMIRYSIFGLICFLIDYFLSLFLKYHVSLNYLLASTIGYIVGIILNYYFSIKCIFTNRSMKDAWHIEMTIFFAIEIVALLIMNLFIYMISKHTNISYAIAKPLGNFAAMAWNYAIKHIFLFKRNAAQAVSINEDTL